MRALPLFHSSILRSWSESCRSSIFRFPPKRWLGATMSVTIPVELRQQRLQVGIAGSYGGLNLGDEAILQVMVSQFRRSLPVAITVLSRDPEDTLVRHRVERAVAARSTPLRDLRPVIESLDLLVLGGGGILFDGDAQHYLRTVEIAHGVRTPVMVYSVGAGPLQDRAACSMVRKCLNRAEVVTVRDHQSGRLLEEIGVRRRIEITADPAFLLEPEPLPRDALLREGIHGQRHLVGMAVREPGPAAPELYGRDYHALLAHTADFMVDRFDADIVFVPMERKMLDLQHAHAVIAKMVHADRATVLKGEYRPGQLLSLFGHFTFAVGMRLHFLIFAALQRVPFAALPCAGKVASFLETFGLTMPPMETVNAGRLIAYIDRSWDLRHELRANIDPVLPVLRQRARESHRIALQLLPSQSTARMQKPPETAA